MVNKTNGKWYTNLEKRVTFHLSCIRVQDAEGMQTERWNLSLFNLSNSLSNQDTSLSVSFDSFIGSIVIKTPGKEVERKYLKLAQLSDCRASERVTKSLSMLLLEVVTTKAVNSDSHRPPPTRLSQPNHFSLTCSFVHLPKCKISSEQRSQNVNKKKKFLSQIVYTWVKANCFQLKIQIITKPKMIRSHLNACSYILDISDKKAPPFALIVPDLKGQYILITVKVTHLVLLKDLSTLFYQNIKSENKAFPQKV